MDDLQLELYLICPVSMVFASEIGSSRIILM